MLRLQPFEICFPEDLDEATSLLSFHGANARICAGGTDLLPNMKHELHEPGTVIHLARLNELKQIIDNDVDVTIGAMTTLHEIATHSWILQVFPALAQAAHHVASPQIRNMGTLGGNLCLDTRCLFYNQSYFWREAIGFCLKKCGDTCHVTKTGKKCVAASSNDTATALISLGASVEIMSATGTRSLPLDQFYVANGERNTCLSPGEILTKVVIPKPDLRLRRHQGFAKLRNREAIDFPMLSVAVCIDTDEAESIVGARLTVNALAAKPKAINVDWMRGKKLSDELAEEAGQFAKARCIPLINICDDPEWRRDMVAVFVKRAIMSAMA